MEAPPVEYVITRDGVRIAYNVTGAGETLVFMPGIHSHLQLNRTHSIFVPSRREMLDGLARQYRLIQFDRRGQGMSGRGLQDSHSLDDLLVDLEAVVDRLGLVSFVLFGSGGGAGHVAVRYAAQHPEQLRALILAGTSVSNRAWPSGMFEVLPSQNWDLFLRSQLAPGLPLDQVDTGIIMLKQITEQRDWEISWRVLGSSDLSSVLPRVTTPTLVIHARDYLTLPAEEAMSLASAITSSRMVVVEGATIFGEVEQSLLAIASFLRQIPTPPHTRPRATRLSSREVDVLRLIAAGRSNPQIAEALVISPNTVGRHVSNIFDKIGVANRAEATAYALRHGLA